MKEVGLENDKLFYVCSYLLNEERLGKAFECYFMRKKLVKLILTL